ncbi:MAG TPA: thiol peroxidase [Chthonomonadales bacterium]|nr:thiol peroxidase [Chthonomonadales bacterium]
MADRTTLMRGNALPLVGPELHVGDPAPDFHLHQRGPEGLKVISLADFAGKTLLISSAFSLETPICEMATRRFNDEAISLPTDVDVVVVSMDLPFAQARFSSEKGMHQISAASDHRDASFGVAYGVLIEPLRLLSRAVFVVGTDGLIKHVEYVPEVTQEPDYETALSVARQPID